jgi:hypothetical protein
MFQTLWIELKRLFSNKLSLALVILAPVITLFAFVSIIAPLIFSNKRLSHVQVTIFNEDQSSDIQLVINEIKDNENIRSLANFVEVDSMSAGMDSLTNEKTALFVHIPAGATDSLYRRERVTIGIWINPDYTFESGMIMPLISGVSDGFNRIQNSIDIVYYRIHDQISADAADKNIYDLAVNIGLRMLNRTGLYKLIGVSPLGRFLPIEYYVSAIFALFIALGLVPLCGYNSADLTSATINRGISSSRHRYKYLFARILSGTVYILLCSLPMFVTGMILMGSGSFFGGNFTALIAALLLATLCFSATAVFLALLFGPNESAAWTGFYYVLFGALMGGVILPDNYLPGFLVNIGHFLPIRAAMNGFAVSLFDFGWYKFGYAILLLVGWLTFFILCSLFLFNKRVRS